jgi:hypothetical protein
MSFQVSAVVAAPSQNAMPETNRRSANFCPSIWGDHFLTYASDQFLVNFIIYCPLDCTCVFDHACQVANMFKLEIYFVLFSNFKLSLFHIIIFILQFARYRKLMRK